jgi:hypothetical protein
MRYLFSTLSATPLRALFMLHTVKAGNGISVTEMGIVEKERITGASSHFWYASLINIAAVTRAVLRAMAQKILQVKHLYIICVTIVLYCCVECLKGQTI